MVLFPLPLKKCNTKITGKSLPIYGGDIFLEEYFLQNHGLAGIATKHNNIASCDYL